MMSVGFCAARVAKVVKLSALANDAKHSTAIVKSRSVFFTVPPEFSDSNRTKCDVSFETLTRPAPEERRSRRNLRDSVFPHMHVNYQNLCQLSISFSVR